jgi:hypothetical protein
MNWKKVNILLFCLCLVLLESDYSQTLAQTFTATGRLNQKGRTGLLVFSGYYGFWLGVVPHLVWDTGYIVNKGKRLPLGPLITTPTSLILTYYLTKNKPVTYTQTSLISLGGHWGTWQGVGWPIVLDKEKETIIGTGALAGLVGIGGGMLLGNTDLFSEGGAALTHSSVFMGAWFGYVAGELFDLNSTELIQNMLVTSNVFMLSTGILFNRTNFKRSNVFRLNGLIYGNATIAWLLYFIYAVENKNYDYDHKTAMVVAGAGSVLGIIGATMDVFNLSEKIPRTRLEDHFKIEPCIIPYTNPLRERKIMPGGGLQFSF